MTATDRARARAAAPSGAVHHVVVARDPNRHKGFAANEHMWIWDNEIVVMYRDARSNTSDINEHTFTGPFSIEQARSLDGGESWAIEKGKLRKPGPPGFPWNGANGPELSELNEPLDFTHPDFGLKVTGAHWEWGVSYFYSTYDRGHSWQGPHRLSENEFGYWTLGARTDYVVNGPLDTMVFVSPGQTDRAEDGQSVWMLRTTDGGQSWRLISRAGRDVQPTGREHASWSIMPSSTRLSSSKLISLNRNDQWRAEIGRTEHWIEAWLSEDEGNTWSFLANIDTGNTSTPPALTRLADDTLIVAYGYRRAPYGIRARRSRDDGRTWDEEVVLRDDGGNFDIGYTRSVLRPDGNIVTAYYYNTDPYGDRWMEATIWHPDGSFAGTKR